MRYVVVIHKDEDSDYGVTVPDLPGCFSAGDTLDQALSNSIEAIECHVEGLFADAEELPTPQSFEVHMDNPDYDKAIFSIVDVDLSNILGSTKRINISMPENILGKIDRFVGNRGGNRSAFLAEASLEYIASHSINANSKNFTPLNEAVEMASQGEVENAHAVRPKAEEAYQQSNLDKETGKNPDKIAKS